MFVTVKFFSYLARPIVLIILTMLISIVLRKNRPRLADTTAVFSLLCLLLFSSPFVANTLLYSLENQFPPQKIDLIPNADLIVLLAGGLELPLPPRLSSELGARSDRLLLTFRLFQAGKAPTVFIPGGNPYPKKGIESEAFYTAEVLESWGIDRNSIMIEELSRNTKQNADSVKNAVSSLNAETIIIVTSAYHMPRAYSLLKDSAKNVIPMPANHFIAEGSQHWMLNMIPSATSLDGSSLALKEYLGILVNQISDW